VSDDQLEQAAGRQYLSFLLGSTEFAIPLETVREILQFEGATRIPRAPPSIRGVINVRGAVVPVVDLGVTLGSGAVKETAQTCVLVVEMRSGAGALAVGVITDAVREVLHLADGQIVEPPALATGVQAHEVTGMAKLGKGFCLLLDIDRVLSASGADVAAQAEVPPPCEC
jgi:purine-binding chemotaxis protein CheW